MADYTGIYAVVRGKLRKTERELPSDDYAMNEDIGILVVLLIERIKRGGIPPSYEGLSAAQKTLFDGAVGRIVASRLRPALLAGANEGKGMEVEKEVGDVRTRYAGYSGSRAPGSVGTVALEDQWINEANEIVALLCKTTRPPSAGSGSFFGAPGRRRADEARDGYRAIDVRELLLPAQWNDRRAR